MVGLTPQAKDQASHPAPVKQGVPIVTQLSILIKHFVVDFVATQRCAPPPIAVWGRLAIPWAFPGEIL